MVESDSKDKNLYTLDNVVRKVARARRNKKWYEQTKVIRIQKGREYYRKNKEMILAKQKQKRIDHPEKAKAIQDRYYRTHSNFRHERNRLNYQKYREKRLQWQKDHYIRVKEIKSKYSKRMNSEIRLRVILHYSSLTNKCACCEEKDIRFLTIDHIHGGGSRQKKENKIASLSRWLIKNNFPEGYQILCFNCNMGRSVNKGICPHKSIHSQT